jgi:hypothetical protein
MIKGDDARAQLLEMRQAAQHAESSWGPTAFSARVMDVAIRTAATPLGLAGHQVWVFAALGEGPSAQVECGAGKAACSIAALHRQLSGRSFSRPDAGLRQPAHVAHACSGHLRSAAGLHTEEQQRRRCVASARGGGSRRRRAEGCLQAKQHCKHYAVGAVALCVLPCFIGRQDVRSPGNDGIVVMLRPHRWRPPRQGTRGR